MNFDFYNSVFEVNLSLDLVVFFSFDYGTVSVATSIPTYYNIFNIFHVDIFE